MKDLTLVFDLDGTLVDTAPDLVAATNHVLQHIGLPGVEEKSLRRWIGHGAHYMVEHAMGPAAEKLTMPERSRLLELFLDFYGRNIAVGSRPFEGTIDALESLSRQGAKLAVCTNKMEHMSRTLLEALGMTRYFASIAGRDTLPTFKPDPGPPARYDQAGRRRSVARHHDRRQPHRHRYGEGGQGPGDRRELRLHRCTASAR